MIFIPTIHRSHLLQHPQMLLQVAEYSYSQISFVAASTNVVASSRVQYGTGAYIDVSLNVPTYRAALNA